MELPQADTIAEVASRVTYTASGASAVLAFLNENASALGLLVAIIGLFVNIYYRRKAHRLLMEQPYYRGRYYADKLQKRGKRE